MNYDIRISVPEGGKKSQIKCSLFKTGDQDSYKMELLEEDKSSELQERFLQVKFLRCLKKCQNYKWKKETKPI